MICLGNPEDDEYIENDYRKLLRLLAVLANEEMTAGEKLRIMEEEYCIAVSDELEGKVNFMCNWSDGVIERVTEKVTKRVTEEVTQQVTQQVTWQVSRRVSSEKDVSGVENIMKAFHVTAERACEVLQISLESYLSAKAVISNMG